MALALTCLNVTLPLLPTPIINNMTSIPTHSYYNPNGIAISQLISASMARSTFSKVDVRSLLQQLTSNDNKLSDVSSIVNIKPIKSAIIYTSVTLVLFLVLSVIFYIISCINRRQTKPSENEHPTRKCKCSKLCVSVVFLLLIGLIVVGQMIYIAYQVSKTTQYLDDSIREINQEVYPKEISLYLKHLLQQMQSLDEYSTQTESSVVKASRSMFVEAFNQILQEQYFLDTIQQSLIESDTHIKELNELIRNDTSLSPGTNLFLEEINKQHQEMITYLKMPLQQLCDYANGSEVEIDKTVLGALNLIHQQLVKLNDTIERYFLSHLTPWENAMLMKGDFEDQVRRYVRLVGTILLVLVIFLGLIPIILLIVIVICCYCHQRRNNTMSTNRQSFSNIHVYKENSSGRPSQSSTEDRELWREKSSRKKSCNSTLCWMQIMFNPIMIIMISIILFTGILYTVDLFAQGACRIVHDDQPFLVSFLIDELLGSNASDLIGGGLDAKTTITTMIDDCRNQIHFSEHFFGKHLIGLQNNVDQAMNLLHKKIYVKFNNSIKAIDIKSDLDYLDRLYYAVSSNKTKAKVQQIHKNLETIEVQFKGIDSSIPTIPISIVNQTVDDLKIYVKTILESTIDACPLPLASMYKADTLMCHDFATTINGLWFSLFIYMFFIIFGLCICGLCIYKQL